MLGQPNPETPDPLSIDIRGHGKQAITRLSGQAGLTAAEKLQRAFLPLLARRVRYLELDVSDLQTLAMLAKRELIELARAVLHRGGVVVLIGPPGHPSEALEITNLEEFYHALERFRAA